MERGFAFCLMVAFSFVLPVGCGGGGGGGGGPVTAGYGASAVIAGKGKTFTAGRRSIYGRSLRVCKDFGMSVVSERRFDAINATMPGKGSGYEVVVNFLFSSGSTIGTTVSIMIYNADEETELQLRDKILKAMGG